MNPPLKISAWDRFLLAIAPGWGMRRLQARAMVRSYEAAGVGRRTSGWHRTGSDANVDNGPSLAALRNISRDLYRNNGWARRGVHRIRMSTVGWGIQAKPVAKKQQAARALELWRAWANTSACDADGRLAFAGLQALAMQTIVQSGECLIVRRTPKKAALPVPLQLRIIEPDLLDSSKDGALSSGGGRLIQGIEFDADGDRVAYWIYPQHPSGSLSSSLALQSVRVPAADVLHVYMAERPGQVRGVPWLCAAISKIQDFDDYDDARLMQQKIAACFGAFVTDLDGSATAIGEPDADDDRLETLEPGHIEYLPPGKAITFPTPPTTSDHGTFSATSLRKIAAAIGVTYEDLTGDYSQVNFSSARMGRLAHYDYVHDWRWHMLIPQLCDGVWRWVMELGEQLGLVRELPAAEWTAPPMAMLDPDKEGLAYTRLMRSGVKSLPQVLRELGEDPDERLAEIAESNERLDELGIVLDSDPRRTTASGQAQASGGSAAPGDDQGDDQGDDDSAA